MSAIRGLLTGFLEAENEKEAQFREQEAELQKSIRTMQLAGRQKQIEKWQEEQSVYDKIEQELNSGMVKNAHAAYMKMEGFEDGGLLSDVDEGKLESALRRRIAIRRQSEKKPSLLEFEGDEVYKPRALRQNGAAQWVRDVFGLDDNKHTIGGSNKQSITEAQKTLERLQAEARESGDGDVLAPPKKRREVARTTTLTTAKDGVETEYYVMYDKYGDEITRYVSKTGAMEKDKWQSGDFDKDVVIAKVNSFVDYAKEAAGDDEYLKAITKLHKRTNAKIMSPLEITIGEAAKVLQKTEWGGGKSKITSEQATEKALQLFNQAVRLTDGAIINRGEAGWVNKQGNPASVTVNSVIEFVDPNGKDYQITVPWWHIPKYIEAGANYIGPVK